MMEIAVIFFDFVGVLLERDSRSIDSALIEGIDRRIGQVINDRDFRAGVLKDYHLSEQDFQRALDQVVCRYQPFMPLWKLLPDLRPQVKLGIINNGTWLTYSRFNRKYKIDQQFDLFLSSALEGVRKPDPEIYLHACQKMRVFPEQCLFMDDDERNVAGALQVGVQGIWWETHQKGLAIFKQLLSKNIEINL